MADYQDNSIEMPYRSAISAVMDGENSKPQARALCEMLTDLDALANDAEMYDEDYLKPTPYALQQMRDLLEGAEKSIAAMFPPGTVYPDGSGGLRVDWVRGHKELRLIVPCAADRRGYLWHLHDAEHSTDYNVSPAALGNWLNWLSDDRSDEE